MLPVATAIQHGAFQSYDVLLRLVFLFTFNGVLIVFERRKKSRTDKETKARCNVPFIRKVRVLHKTRLIFPRINGPIETFTNAIYRDF